ncbi:MAG: hypothetical protein IJ659_07560 [Alloprevotella sp.]|nr:hypothetical protein [Alloprevotella sp.]
MKRAFIHRFCLAACAFLLAAAAWADGEQRNHEAGTKWVDPVEFYHLQDVNRTDFQRDYDQGDIDFNKEVAKKGTKVYGLRLKPIAAAFDVEKYFYEAHWLARKKDFPFKVDYQDLYGIRGVPLHESGFCVYMDEPVSISYTYSDKYQYENSVCYFNDDYNVSCTISNLRLTTSESGVNFSYHISFRKVGDHHSTDKKTQERQHLEQDPYSKEFTFNGNSRYGHFIYFNGSRDLLVMISAPRNIESDEDWLKAPTCRVYFIVEQILVEDEGGPILSEEDRQELVNYLSDLVTWISGEGDPLGLGEHTDANTSAVINAIATVAAVLLGNGIASIVGGSASTLVSNLASEIAGGAPPLPGGPNAPDLMNMEGLKGRKPEEDDDSTPPPPPEPADPFESDMFKQYVNVDEDGDWNVKDPVTGKETIYRNNGDGTYTNLTTGQSWTPEEINERLGYREDNREQLGKDAEQAAKNAAEQHAQWEKESTQLSQDAQDYLNWKHTQEAAMEKEIKIDHLAHKYGVAPTETAVKNAIKFEQNMNMIDSETYTDLANQWDKGAERLAVVDKTCEVSVNVMATFVPGGEAVKDGYTFAKSTMVAVSEAIGEGKSLGEGLAHVAVGAADGALGVIQNQAGNMTKGQSFALGKEYAVTIVTEDLKEGMKEYYKTGDMGKAGAAMINATGKKTAEFAFSKTLNYGLGKMKDSATKALSGGDSKMSEGMAKKVDYWFNKDHVGHLGKRAEVFKIKVSDSGKISWGGKGPGFSTFYSGKVNFGNMAEGAVNEAMNQTGMHDWAGRAATGVSDFVSGKAGEYAYDAAKAFEESGGADVFSTPSPEHYKEVMEFAQNVRDFSEKAATYRKQ